MLFINIILAVSILGCGHTTADHTSHGQNRNCHQPLPKWSHKWSWTPDCGHSWVKETYTFKFIPQIKEDHNQVFLTFQD